MEQVATEKQGNLFADTTQRLKKRSELLVKLISDPAWQPPCVDCRTENENCFKPEGYMADDYPARHGLIRLEDGEGYLHLVNCPLYSRDCATGRKVEAIISRRIERQKNQWLNQVDIPEKHRKATKSGIMVSAAEILDYLDRWPVAEGHGLVVVGPKGTGKSGTLALVGLEAYARGMTAIDVHFTTLTRLMFALCSKKEEAYWPGRLLLLDELGQAYESDFAFAIFEDYLNWRYERNLTTCVAANLLAKHNPDFPNVGSLEDDKYARIADRWRETCDVVVMAGRSRRQPEPAYMAEMRAKA